MVLFSNEWCLSYIQEKNKAKCVSASYILSFVYTYCICHSSVWSRSLVLYRSRVCGETSTTLAETQSSVSSVGVQCKGSFILFLVIKMSLFPASVWK